MAIGNDARYQCVGADRVMAWTLLIISVVHRPTLIGTLALLSTLATSSAMADDSYYLAFSETPLRTLDVRLGMGQVTESVPGSEVGFVLEPVFAGRFALEGTKETWNTTVMPEIGGSFWETEHTRGSLLTLGLGLGWSKDYIVAGIVPALVTGQYQRGDIVGDATGYRVTAMFEILQVVGVQTSYQKLRVDGKITHQGMVTASLNLIPLYILGRLSGG